MSEAGDKVLMKPIKGNKMTTPYWGMPLTDAERNGNSILISDDQENLFRWNTSHLKPYVERETDPVGIGQLPQSESLSDVTQDVDDKGFHSVNAKSMSEYIQKHQRVFNQIKMKPKYSDDYYCERIDLCWF
jgi:hypothetical protein